MKRLGIIGGMGPLATVDLFSKIISLTPAKKDQDHIPIIIDNYPQIEDRTAYIIDGKTSPLPKLLESADRLKSAGAEALLMPCNTAHYFADALVSSTKLPLIHITECCVKAIQQKHHNAKRIAVIATTGTKGGKVYETILHKNSFEVIEFDKTLEADIMSCIYDGVKAGKTAEYKELFQSCVNRVALLKADVIIAGCTEIPLLLPHIDSEVPVIDATLELAKAAVNFALNGETN